jgi:hypothetical protein
MRVRYGGELPGGKQLNAGFILYNKNIYNSSIMVKWDN